MRGQDLPPKLVTHPGQGQIRSAIEQGRIERGLQRRQIRFFSQILSQRFFQSLLLAGQTLQTGCLFRQHLLQLIG